MAILKKDNQLKKNIQKKIAFFSYSRTIGSGPTILSVMKALNKKGYSVDFYITNQKQDLDIPGENKIYSNGRGSFSILFFTLLFKYLILSFFRLLKRKYNLFISFDFQTIFVVYLFSKIFNVTFIYINLELLVSKDIKSIRERIQKYLERIASRKAKLVASQDIARLNILLSDNKIETNKGVILPNSFKFDSIVNTGYFKKKYLIPQNTTIIISAGSISQTTLSWDIANASLSWPKNWYLIFHGWGDDKVIKNIISLKSPNIIISRDFVPYSKLGEILSSADIGLAFYNNLSSNIYNIGSSGKLSDYLQCNLPIIAIDFLTFKEIVEKNKCGICVSNPKMIKPAVLNILESITDYKANCQHTFNKFFDFENNFKNIYNKLKL